MHVFVSYFSRQRERKRLNSSTGYTLKYMMRECNTWKHAVGASSIISDVKIYLIQRDSATLASCLQ